MKILKKNQVVIYTLAFMLVTAGYLNYTSNLNKTEIETSALAEEQLENNSVEESNIEEAPNQDSAIVENNETGVSSENKNINEEDNQSIENNKVADIGDATLVSSNDIVSNYYVKTKLERDTMYSQMIEAYEKILNSSNSLETQKQSATQEITKINNTKNSIMICENLIQTKGFENCVVLVNDTSISVIVRAENLKTEQIAQIQNIISRELKAEIENIHISTK